MKFWNYQQRPYRPVESREFQRTDEGFATFNRSDVFMDSLGRLWYASTATLQAQLPADPLKEKTIPPEFWHPEVARRRSIEQHNEQKQQLEDERADLVLV